MNERKIRKKGERKGRKEGWKPGKQWKKFVYKQGHAEGFRSSVFPLLIPQIRLSKFSISQKSRLLAIYNLL